jgi:hypothetical protein
MFIGPRIIAIELSGHWSQVTMSSRYWVLLHFKLMIWTWAIH